ncbi:putative pumilio homolog 7, chloroplastic [Hibiscus syriacus]|uniref:putative pumilio homolog 7, chloroplastic n=1 Tax=Hibiscus syriacus TaxID=106335 RepID=UPI00192103F3|nr:putative pumilio homolog 7, chloroplastic [Hibiscus syriacus]
MFKVGEIRDMKRNSELETLSSESPQTPPFLNRQHYSPMTRVSPPPSRSFSIGFPSPEKSSPFEDRRQQRPNFHHYGLPDFHFGNNNANENKRVHDGFDLCENLYQMHIGDEEINGVDSAERRGSESDPYGLGLCVDAVSSYNAGKYSSYEGFNKGFQSYPQQVSTCFDGNDVMRSTLLGGNEKDDSLGSYGIGYNQSNDLFSKPSWYNNRRDYISEKRMEQCRSFNNGGILLQNALSTRPYCDNLFVYSQQCGMDGNGGRGVTDSLSSPGFLHSKIPIVEDHSVIKQGRDLKYGVVDNLGHDSFKCHKKKSLKGIAMQNLKDKRSKLDRNHGKNVRLMPSPYSLVEFRGCINYMAKDQNDCRFLQRIFDEGSYLDVQIIFNEIIHNIVELMMDPFGNYLVQKLLDVCTEEQRLQIVLMVTKEAGQLVRISLNTHGTRVVQRLIETLKSKHQISLIKYALKPGILDLIKDLNGNHVLQRCLQCLDNEDNKIIFEAAVQFCVDIATHRHGCCVLQRCIAHSTRQHRDNLITQVSRNGLLLAQDPFGNYVIQYIIELKVPSAAGNLLSQFKGHYVHLSMQKFSSHVIEKCLKHFAESRSQIIHELISVVHFEQLLQDPFANYVIQSGLAVTKGPLHASLVGAVRPHTILRTSPYCKRIFSRNLLKK